MASLSDNYPFFVSFGRRKEWNYWFLLAPQVEDHWENFARSAKAIEEQLQLEKSPLDDVTFLEKVVDDLVKNRGYNKVTFPAICATLDESTRSKIQVEVKDAFETINMDSSLHPDFLLLYSRNEYWDHFKLDLFRQTESLQESLTTEINKAISANPNLLPLDIHSQLIAKLKKKGIEPLEIDHLSITEPTRNLEGLSLFWEKWLSKDFLTNHLVKETLPPIPKSDSPF